MKRLSMHRNNQGIDWLNDFEKYNSTKIKNKKIKLCQKHRLK